MTPKGLDLTRLVVGSEGTLGIIVEAILRTTPLPLGHSAALFGFTTLEAALRATQYVRETAPSACELLDRRLLTMTRSHSLPLARMIPTSAEAVLLVDWERPTESAARQIALATIEGIQQQAHLASFVVPALDREAIERLWTIPRVALPSLYSLRGGSKPLAFVEDVGVHPDEVPEFLNRLQSILQRCEVTAAFLIHAAAGQIHTAPFLDLGNPNDAPKLWALAEAIHQLAIEMGGTISTRHGVGIARTPWVEKQYGRLFPVFREVKRIFDPQSILNPGKIVGLDPSRPAWPLRAGVPCVPATESTEAMTENREAPWGDSSTLSTERIPLMLRWMPGELGNTVASCNGCGDCRTQVVQQRMCPMFRVTRTEAATPRAKANLMRILLDQPKGIHSWTTAEVREVADLCINCKMCVHECTSHVNVPKLMLETKAAFQAEHGLDRTDWVMARIESFAALGGKFALTTNTLLSSRVFRWVAEKLFGVSRHRRLPVFAARSFLKRATRRGWTRPRNPRTGASQPNRAPASRIKVAYFVDTFANYIDPTIAEATVAVLHHHGIQVLVPPRQIGCGMAPLAWGDVETARDIIHHNVRILANLVRDGYRIVCSEPTAAIVLRQDAQDLIDDPDTRLVAQHTIEMTAFLAELEAEGRFRTDFQPLPLSLGHHVPCHVKALGSGVHGPRLLGLIPQLRVHTIDVSCSGMAGTYGLKARNFEASLEAGRPMLQEMNRPRVLFGSTECSSCRMQMEQGSNKRTLHPMQYLALAYGLMPEIAERLKEPLQHLIST